tara:strand:- start:4126 stop:5958 length:1833 start_codon:yes stop_codon:yes gene_type:complete
MCGIAGIIVQENRQNNIDGMLKVLKHRGPDGSGVFDFEAGAIGQSRLAIIDVDGGAQPMSDTLGKYWITYNGELYNYRELRTKLKSKGYPFRTDSDTEVLIQAYAHWGKKCVNYFRGMYAFCIVDTIKRELFLARDPFGIKPLVYAHNSEVFAFASEIQALRPVGEINWDINLTAIDQYLTYQYIPAPNTIYREINKLPPAHYMRVNFSGEIKELLCYWQLDFKPDYSRTEKDWMEELEYTIKESVNVHLVADVPFGAFLSGGIDSSLVVGYMSKVMSNPVKTFSIGFEEEEFSELGFAREVASYWGTDHFEAIVKPDALAILPEVVKHYGEPFGDSSVIPTYYLSKLARQHVTMALSGDAGDELFAGYSSYTDRWSRHFSAVPEHLGSFKKELYPILSAVFPQKYPLRTSNFADWQRYIQFYGIDARTNLWKKEFTEQFLKTDAIHENKWNLSSGCSHFHRAQMLDFQTYLPNDILAKVDIASMMHSLEVRTPLLDLRVVELASQIPEEYNINKASGKWQGKQLLKKIISMDLGDKFAFREKMGFAAPISKWFADTHKSSQEVSERLLSQGNGLDTFFEKKELERVAKGSNSGQQWLLVFLQEWMEQNK